MILVILTAFVAVCGAAKLDNTYLPPLSSRTAGGSASSLLAPLEGSNKGLPSGSFTNDVQGVVVDAVNPGTRTSGHEPTGLGAPRPSYGSKDSRVGEAAFSGSVNTRIAPGFDSFVKSGDAQAHKANGNTLKFTSDVGLENYSYGFETDNGISVGENGEAADGVKAQGGYSYQGDDGKTYSVSYTADEGGYKPQGEHLPTSPPIPEEILISLEKNAKEEAAGHVDDGSYDAQKYNDEGDYSSNGSGYNNGKLTIGSGVATSGGSQVSQSSHRPTSGVLVGAYKPSTATHSSQGPSRQGFSQGSTIGGQTGSKDGNSLSHGSSSHGAHAGLSSHSTENRFGFQPTNSEGYHAHAQTSISGSILRSPSFEDGASTFSSAVARGPGSANAFASSGPISSGLKNNNLPILNSFETAGQHTHGSESSFGASFPTPSTATASASVSGIQETGSNAQSHSPNLPSSASASSSVSGNQLSYGSNQAAHSFGSSPTPANSISSTHTGASSTQKPFTGQQQGIDNSYIYKHPSKPFVTPSAKPSSQYTNNHQPNFPISPITQQGSNPNTATTAANGQYHGTSSPSYDGITQAAISSFTSSSSSTQFGSQSSQFGTKPSTQFGQSGQQTSTQFGSSETHKPIVQSHTQFGQSLSSQTSDSSQSPTQQYQGTIYQYNKPATTLAAQGNKDSSSSFAQATFSQTNSQAKPVKTETRSRFGTQQSSSQFGSQSTFQTGSNAPTFQFGQKPIVSSQVSGSNNQFGSSGSHFGQKPLTTQGSIDSSNTQGQSSFGQKPVGSSQTTLQFGSTGSQFGPKPQITQGSIVPSNIPNSFGQKPVGSSQTTSQFGSIGSQIGSNTQSSQGSGQKPLGSTNQQTQFGSQFGSKPTQATQGSSFTYSQSTSQTSQFGKKPISTTQFGTSGSQIGHSSQFGSSGSQFSQNAQSTFGSGSVSSTTKPSVSQNPFGSSNQQTQFGSTGSQFGQNVHSSLGTGSISSTGKPSVGSSYQQTQFGSKPQTTQGSSFTYSQSTSQTSQFEKKPVITTQTGIPSQQTQFGSSGSQFTQNAQSSFGSGSVSSTTKPSFSQKPFGASNQQTQFGSTGSQFGQNVQSSLGTGSISSTGKPSVGSSYQQTQFGSKPQNTQGSSFTYSQSSSQTSQFEKKPVITTQTGVPSQQTQFGSAGSQFSQNAQSSFGSGSVSSTTKPSFSQKPFGSSNQQTQFGSTGSQFGQNVQSSLGTGSISSTGKPSVGSSYQQTQFGSKPQNTQGSSFTYSQSTSQTSQFEKKPVITTPTGVPSQQTQFGSAGSQFSQNTQSTFGSGSVSSTTKPSFSQKPFGSSNQQTQFGSTGSQFGQNGQSSLGTGSIPSTGKPSFGSSYQQTQFGSKPQTTQGSSFTYSQSTSQTSQFEKKPVITTQTSVPSQQTQFGSSGSQISQNAQSSFGSGSVSSTTKPSFSQKPFGSSNQQTQFGSTGSQFGQNLQSSLGTGSFPSTGKPSVGSSYQQTQFGSKPQTTQGSSFTYSQSTSQTSQFEKKPVITTQTGVPSQQTQFGSSGSQFSQNAQSSFGSGSVSSTTKPSFSQKPFGSSNQQTQFGSTGSQFGQNVQSSLGTGSISSTGKPSVSSSYQQTQFGSKPQTTQGSSYTYSQSQTSQYGNKPVFSTTQTGTQQTQFGSTGTQVSQTLTTSKPSFGQKPFGSSNQQTQFGSTGTGSQFGQNSHFIQGVGSTSTNSQTSFGIKPVYQQAQFGSTASQNSQGQTSQFGKKPVSTTHTVQESQFGSSGSQIGQNSPFGQSGSQFGQNAQPTQGSSAGLSSSKPVNGQQPYGSSYQQTQFGSSVSQFGQNSQSSQGLGSVSTTFKPTFGQTSFGSSSQQTQFGSQFGKKPQSTQGSSSTSHTYSQSQTSQFGKKPQISQTGSAFQQNQFGSTGSQFGQKPLTTTVTGVTSTTGQASISHSPSSTAQGGSFSQQSHFGSIGSHLDQKPLTATQGSSYATNTESKGPVVQTTQFGITDSSQNGPSSQSIQYGSGNKLSGSAAVSGSGLQQAQLAGPSGSHFGQTTQTTQGIISQVQPVQTTHYGIKPFDSSQNTQGSTQVGSTPSRFSDSSQTAVPIVTTISQTVQPTQFGQKPFQTEFGSTAGHFGQKPQAQANAFASSGNVVPFGITQTGQGIVSATQKPSGSSLSQTNYQKVQQTQSNFNSAVSTSQKPINNQPLKPVGFSSTPGSVQQSQSTVSSSQFGAQPAKPADISGPVIQTSYNQLSGQPFQPASTASSHGSNAQSSAVFTSQSGLQSTQPAVTTYFDRKPLGSSSTQGSGFGSQTLVGSKPNNPSVFSSGQASSVLSGVGSNVGPVVSTIQTPILSGPGYDIVTSNQGGAHGFAGLGEQFGGPRNPPSFDEKTGYHY